VLRTLSYLKARLGEGSTWTAFGVAAAGAAALAAPWSYVAVACGVIAALVPTTKKEA
jgi:hypothetical protein